MAFWAEESKKRAGERRGLGSQAAEPRSPAPKTWVIRAEYRGGNWPNTRNPAGDADGVWVGSVGGDAPKLARGQRGSGGTCCPTRVNHLVARRSDRFRPGGTRYRIRFRAGQGLYSRPLCLRFCVSSSLACRHLPTVRRPAPTGFSSTRDEAMEAFARCWFRKAC